MGAFRSAAFRILTSADQHKRLRIVYPIASRASDTPTFVHSKVMVVDDVLARIGSANFSQRSLGVDSECDVAADAGDDSKARDGVRRIRNRLLGEHLDMPADDVAREVARLGSVRALVDARGTHDHTLTPIEILPEKESTAVSDLLRTAADPDEPMAFGPAAASVIPRVDARTGYGPMRLWILPAVAFAAALGVAWPSPEVVSALPAATLPMLWAAAGVFVLAGAFLVPLELLAILTGLLFGLERGAAVATAGSLAAAVFGYAAGRAMGPRRIARWMSRRSHRSVRQLGTRGILGIVVLHMSTVASASAIHLASGASRLRFASFVAGTALTVVPTAALLSGLGALLRYTLKFPSRRSALLAMGATLLLMAAAAALRGLLVIRQFAPSVSRHRERAEFG
jgi:uncharacterized membrane protein YdjX (TVP38/TMEM64 family)